MEPINEPINEPIETRGVRPSVTYPNGDLLYIANPGKILLQVETGRKYKKALEPHDHKHYAYEEIDDE